MTLSFISASLAHQIDAQNQRIAERGERAYPKWKCPVFRSNAHEYDESGYMQKITFFRGRSGAEVGFRGKR